MVNGVWIFQAQPNEWPLLVLVLGMLKICYFINFILTYYYFFVCFSQLIPVGHAVLNCLYLKSSVDIVFRLDNGYIGHPFYLVFLF